MSAADYFEALGGRSVERLYTSPDGAEQVFEDVHVDRRVVVSNGTLEPARNATGAC